ncbi:DUF2207 domain-containing protein [Candidatus Nomurabacteria bacterium]|nr:DUF2207 domain-containing protein [Candidatus Saccharibacteria bacterium]MCB9839530.1 DUF2207 domain-containing protein [Candidatus Nomurabacteria bacterium]
MIKKWFLLLPVIGIFMSGLATVNAPIARAQNTQNFSVQSFDAQYDLAKNEKGISQMSVKETITADFPNYDQNHGLRRAIPKVYNGVDLKLNIKSVVNQTNGSAQYSSYAENDNLVLKIGDPASYVRGPNTYVIEYSLSNVITKQNDWQEFFWNINGTQWAQPVNNLSVRLNLSPSVTSGFNGQLRCLTGAYGQSGSNCQIVSNNDEKETVITAKTSAPLAPGENLSIVVGFAPDTFKIDEVAILKAKIRQYLPFALIIFLPLVASLLLLVKWLKVGRDAEGRGLIVPQYVPYKDLVVVEADTLLHEQLTQKGVTAQIIELATKKYLVIAEIGSDKKVLGLKIASSKDYELTIVKSIEDLSESEARVIGLLFGQNTVVGSKVKLGDLKDSLYKEMKKVSDDIPSSLYKRGYFSTDPSKAYMIFLRPTIYFLAIAATLVGVSFLLGLLPSGSPAFIAIVSILAIVVVNLIAMKILPAKTTQGTDAKEYLLGLKEYIKLAEADRLKYLQSPEGAEKYGDPNTDGAKIKLFEKLLPYAIIFGLEKDWANSFEGIYSEPPDWYQGNWSAFNTGVLLGSVSAFSSASTASFAAPSSSGGASGFSGGGFSGGGGGGGGGGGW